MNITHESVFSEVKSGRLVALGAAALPLIGTRLRVEAAGGMARVVCEQRLKNPHSELLHVSYSLPLPADAAVSGFAFVIGERRIVGEIERTAVAREQFEEALLSGRSAAILEQERSSLFTQELGNIPPGATITAEVTLDQPLLWVDGEWEWRFPTTVMPRYLGPAGRVNDAARMEQDIADAPLAARLQFSLSVTDELRAGTQPNSPSHAVLSTNTAGACEVELVGGVPLDRDLVVRWAVAQAEVGVSISVTRTAEAGALGKHAYGLLTVVPPHESVATLARDLIVLLDTSGSMSGAPLAQAVRLVSSLVDSLREDDTLEMIEFSSRPQRWKKSPVHATEAACKEAFAWLARLRAGGCTEMHSAIAEALRPVRSETQRQVILITDGAIAFETEVINAICSHLAPNCRLHTVGIGSAVNRSLTAPAARAGRGIETLLGVGEDVERAAARLLRRTSAPALVELQVAGSAVLGSAPARLPDLFSGAPVLVGVLLRPEGGVLTVRGQLAGGAVWSKELTIAPIVADTGRSVNLTFFGRERVEDLELDWARGEARDVIEAKIEQEGLAFRIATRKTSWLAMTEEVTVDPSRPTRRVRMPHQLPHGASIDGLGLRAASALVGAMYESLDLKKGSPAPYAGAAPLSAPAPSRSRSAGGSSSFGRARGGATPEPTSELKANVRILTPRRMVANVVSDRTGFWTLGDRIEVQWLTGESVDATVEVTSTAAGLMSAGQTARLVLNFATDMPAGMPMSIIIHTGASKIVIRL